MLNSFEMACAQKLFAGAIMIVLASASLVGHEIIQSGVGIGGAKAHEKSQSFSKWRST